MDAIWSDLKGLAEKVEGRSMLSLFEDDTRAARFSRRLDDMLFDFSKTQIDDAVLARLIDLARAAGVEARRDAMFAGARSTRPRAARCCTRRSGPRRGRSLSMVRM
jgi:glucose-6-phosphate isomerase